MSADQNPIIRVIRKGKHFVSNDINDDDKLTDIWKENALSLGFKSFAVFPLIVLKKVIGAGFYSNVIF